MTSRQDRAYPRGIRRRGRPFPHPTTGTTHPTSILSVTRRLSDGTLKKHIQPTNQTPANPQVPTRKPEDTTHMKKPTQPRRHTGLPGTRGVTGPTEPRPFPTPPCPRRRLPHPQEQKSSRQGQEETRTKIRQSKHKRIILLAPTTLVKKIPILLESDFQNTVQNLGNSQS